MEEFLNDFRDTISAACDKYCRLRSLRRRGKFACYNSPASSVERFPQRGRSSTT